MGSWQLAEYLLVLFFQSQLTFQFTTESSHPREPPPEVLTDTDVNVSAHPAPPIQSFHTINASVRTIECFAELYAPTSALLGVYDLSDV